MNDDWCENHELDPYVGLNNATGEQFVEDQHSNATETLHRPEDAMGALDGPRDGLRDDRARF